MLTYESTPTPLGAGSVLLLCIFGGASFGCLPTAMGRVVDLSSGPLSIISEVPFPGDFILSSIFGGGVGLLCSPFALALLTGRRRGAVLKLIFGMVTAIVTVLTVLFGCANGPSNSLFRLMFFSGLGFVVVCALVALVVPKVITAAGRCRYCGYDLRGSLDMGRCPECGKPFDRAEAMSGGALNNRVPTVGHGV